MDIKHKYTEEELLLAIENFRNSHETDIVSWFNNYKKGIDKNNFIEEYRYLLEAGYTACCGKTLSLNSSNLFFKSNIKLDLNPYSPTANWIKI